MSFKSMHSKMLVGLTQTCFACPSSWEGKTANGEEFYARYRWGTLRVDINGETVYRESVGDYLDGFMTTEEMLVHTGFLYSTKEDWEDS